MKVWCCCTAWGCPWAPFLVIKLGILLLPLSWKRKFILPVVHSSLHLPIHLFPHLFTPLFVYQTMLNACWEPPPPLLCLPCVSLIRTLVIGFGAFSDNPGWSPRHQRLNYIFEDPSSKYGQIQKFRGLKCGHIFWGTPFSPWQWAISILTERRGKEGVSMLYF